MLLYTTLGTNDLPRARDFYGPTLATLGIEAKHDGSEETGYGPNDSDSIRLYVTRPYDQNPATRGNGSMLAFDAATPAQVNAFHAIALANGGSDEGAPGLRYSASFYSCYVRDPDGNKLSAVCDRPE